jgi:hypothetical protein
MGGMGHERPICDVRVTSAFSGSGHSLGRSRCRLMAMSGHATAAAPLHAKRVRQPAELGRELQALHAVPLQLRIRVQRALIFGSRKPRCLAALQAGKFGDQVLPDVTQRCSQDEDQRESGNYHRPPCRPALPTLEQWAIRSKLVPIADE